MSTPTPASHLLRRSRRHRRRTAATAVAVVAGLSPVVEVLESRTMLASSFSLVKDINANSTYSPAPSSIADVNGTLFVSVGWQLWKTDGTQAGTSQITPPDYPNPTSMTNVNGTLFFFGANGGGLWKSDGTAAGTVQLATLQNATDLTNVNGTLYFRGSDGASGYELWKSDGTAAGTVRVKDINAGAAGSDPRGLTNVNGKLFFHASDGVHGDELWTSDGTDAGTQMVRDINPGAGTSEPLSLTNVNGTLFFIAHSADNSGYELWKSDGSAAGTVQVKDIRPGLPGSSPTMLRAVNGKLMFCATDGQHGYELWTSDGTDAGTQMVKDLVPGGGSPMLDNFTVVGGTLFFTANDGTSGTELWKSDGTAAGTIQVKDIAAGVNSSGPDELTAMPNGKLIFTANDGTTGQEIWISDGTANGTHLLAETFPGGYSTATTNFTASGSNRFYFIGDDGSGPALWISDFTAAGTVKFKSFNLPQAQSSNPSQGVRIGSTIFFTADDGVHGQELWKSDGTTAGTSLVADLNPGQYGSYPSELTNFNGALYFVANGKLYTSDGTSAGTVPVNPTAMSPSKLTVVGSTLYFLGWDGAGGELWKSDGTASGTSRVKDINPGSGSSSLDYLTNVNDTLFFSADDGTHGAEVWKSDGTAAGTVLVKDIRAGSTSSGPALLTNVNGTLFFRASDAVNGYELWKSDGTAAGTQMVKDIRPGGGDAYIRSLTAFNNIVFFVADDGVHGEELWSSDGTAAGTNMLSDIRAGSQGSSPDYLSNLGNGKFLFKANDGIHGEELWTSDGTPAGTVLLKDIYPGATGGSISRAFVVDGTLFFWAADNTRPFDLYVSDGTALGTYGLQYPLNNGLPDWAAKLNGTAYIDPWNSLTGAELYSIGLDRPAGSLTASTQPATPATQPLSAAAAMKQSADSIAGGDVLYDLTNYGDKPQTEGAAGLAGGLLLGPEIRADWNFEFPDEAKTRAFARQAFNAGVPLVLDIENWAIDPRTTPEATVQMNLEKFQHVADWAHDECPGLAVGFWALAPVYASPVPAQGTPQYVAWQAANQRIKSLIDRSDIIFPEDYTRSDDPNAWLADGEGKISEDQLFGKKTQAFLWPQFYGWPANAARRMMSGAMWREELDVSTLDGDGAAIWSDGGVWDDDSAWWTITRDFLIDSTPSAPATASNLAAAAVTPTRVDLIWKDNAYDESGYRIERKLDGDPGPFVPVGTVGQNVTTYSDTGLNSGSTYDYRVIALNAGGDGAASNQASANTLNVVPLTPTNPGTTVLSASRVRVDWTDASTDEAGFAIERAVGGGAFSQIDTVPANVTTFTDSGLSPGVTYRYRIRAYNDAGTSAPSVEASATTLLTNSNLLAHWSFDDSLGGTASDTAGGNHAGALVNGPTWTSTGLLGYALSFDGVDDRVEVSDSPALNFTSTSSFTVSAWVDLPSLPNMTVGVVTKNAGAGEGNVYGITIDDTNHWRFAGATADLVGSVASTGWSLVTVVQDASAGQRLLYVNGALVASAAATQAGDGTGELVIGGTGVAGQYFAGKIDDVRIYGRALSPSEAALLATPNVTLPGTPGDDAWTVRLDAADANYEFLLGNAVSFTRPIDSVASIAFAGGAGNDTLTLDFTNGDPIPLYGFSYDAGPGAGNSLQIQGGGVSLGLFADGTHFVQSNVPGTLTYGNVQTMTVSGATLTASGDLSTNLVVGNQGIASFARTQHLASLTVLAGGLARLPSGANVAVVTNSLAIAPTGSLDVGDNALILHTLPLGSWNGSIYTGVSGMISAARNGGSLWTGIGGITTSDARAHGAGGSGSIAQATLAVARVGDVRSGVADNQTTLFAGQSVFGSDTVVMLTYAGDANLDGKVNIDDYTRIDAGIASQLTGYSNGDFNYDGKINIDDYTIIDNSIATQGGKLFNASSLISGDAAAIAASIVAQSAATAAATSTAPATAATAAMPALVVWTPRASIDDAEPATKNQPADDDTTAPLQ